MPQYLSTPLFQASDASANPLVGAKEYIYQTGTTTLLSLFSDELLTTPISNPLIADSAGVFPLCFIAETKFKVVLTTSADVTLYTRDPVYSTGQADNVSASNVTFDGTGIGFSSTNVQDAIVELYGSTVTLDGAAFNGPISVTQSTTSPFLTLTSSDAGSGVGPDIDLFRDSVSPAASDGLGYISFTGRDSAANKQTYADMFPVILDPTSGSEDARFDLRVAVAGTMTTKMSIGTGGVTLSDALNLANGAAATPQVACTANSDMGIYFPGGTAIGFTVDSVDIARVSTNAIHIGKTSGNLTGAGTSFFATGASNGLFQCTRDSDIVGQFNVINPVGTETVLEFMTSGTARGSVTINGGTTAYNTSSDRRLKENRRDFDAGAILEKIKVWEFDWKEDGSVGHGVMAQEAVKAYPQAISRPQKRRQKWQADYSKYVPLLIRECQAQRKEIQGLRDEIGSLRSQLLG